MKGISFIGQLEEAPVITPRCLEWLPGCIQQHLFFPASGRIPVPACPPHPLQAPTGAVLLHAGRIQPEGGSGLTRPPHP